MLRLEDVYDMKVLSIGIVLALPLVAGCGQTFNQNPLASGDAESMRSAVSAKPNNNCAHGDAGTSSTGGFIRWKNCNGYTGHMTYGPGTTGGIKLDIQPSTTNPGGIPVPPGETPVLFVQQLVRPTDPSPVTFTAPTVPPAANKSRILGVPAGTYQLYVYNGSTQIAGPFVLGSPVGGILRFTSPPYSPLPSLGTQGLGVTYTFELVTP